MLNQHFLELLNELSPEDKRYATLNLITGISASTIAGFNTKPLNPTPKYYVRALEILNLLPDPMRLELISQRLTNSKAPKPQHIKKCLPILKKLEVNHVSLVKLLDWERGSFQNAEKKKKLPPYIAFTLEVIAKLESDALESLKDDHYAISIDKENLALYLKTKKEDWDAPMTERKKRDSD